VFTRRAREFVQLADELRRAGFRGHITAGGHFATFNARRLLADYPAIDSIVHGEGEEAIVDLAEYLSAPESVLGISYRLPSGEIKRPRNFGNEGMNLQAMKLDYYYHILRHFHPDRATSSLEKRVKGLICELNLNSAELLTELLDFACSEHDRASTADFAARLAAERDRFDAGAAGRAASLIEEMRGLAAGRRPGAKGLLPYAAALVITVAGCKDKDTPATGPVPPPVSAQKEPPAYKLDSPPSTTDRVLSEKETLTVNEYVADHYFATLNPIAEKYDYTDEKAELLLELDNQGRVTTVRVILSPKVHLPDMEEQMQRAIKQWRFPSIRSEGWCKVVLVFKSTEGIGTDPTEMEPEPPDE